MKELKTGQKPPEKPFVGGSRFRKNNMKIAHICDAIVLNYGLI
jgi:hypothetical protein